MHVDVAQDLVWFFRDTSTKDTNKTSRERQPAEQRAASVGGILSFPTHESRGEEGHSHGLCWQRRTQSGVSIATAEKSPRCVAGLLSQWGREPAARSPAPGASQHPTGRSPVTLCQLTRKLLKEGSMSK